MNILQAEVLRPVPPPAEYAAHSAAVVAEASSENFDLVSLRAAVAAASSSSQEHPKLAPDDWSEYRSMFNGSGEIINHNVTRVGW